ncbi:MAG TPA: hypothetical protein V6C69_20030 [Trichormus sp.]|jgi:hypothetical protein
MDDIEKFRFIWIEGNTKDLLNNLREYLRSQYGEEAIVTPLIFLWNDNKFGVRHSKPFGTVITIPVFDVYDRDTWNEQLKLLYQEVVRPVADRTGGVTVGLGEPGEINTAAPRSKGKS